MFTFKLRPVQAGPSVGNLALGQTFSLILSIFQCQYNFNTITPH